MIRTTLVSIAVAWALALPATALAQSAGDNQYQDPLATPNSSTKHSSGSGSGSTGTAPSQGTSNGSSGSSGTAGASSSSGTGAASGAAATGTGLPRTGGHPVPLALIGVGLLGAGLGVRRLAFARR
ncbi:MAG: hypothetical protein ACJ77M_10275 [Thermoleophilaceae bacterium]